METLVIDIGSGFTKVGFAGNFEPTHIFPSVMCQRIQRLRNFENFLDIDLGASTTTKFPDWEKTNILDHGAISDWDAYERFMHEIYFDKLRADPEEHYTLLTEPPMTPPEDREKLAELMFETFHVPAFYIGVQAVMALFASRISKKTKKDLTGVVVDSGAGVTHVIPIVSGYVLSSCIKQLPLAGGDITKFIAKMLRDRKENIPTEMVLKTAEEIKEAYSYNCPDIIKEFGRFDLSCDNDSNLVAEEPKKVKENKTHYGFKKHTFEYKKKEYSVDVGYEQFLAPEIFFNPDLYGSNFTHTLPQLVDQSIRQSPMMSRLSLYQNIILSGGSTLFKGFDKRLQRDMNRIIKNEHNNKRAEARVITHSKQKYAVWFGSSLLAKIPEFGANVHTRERYEEEGPRIARHNAVFFE